MKKEVPMNQSVDAQAKLNGPRVTVPCLTAQKYMKDYRSGLMVDKTQRMQSSGPLASGNLTFSGPKSISHRSWTTRCSPTRERYRVPCLVQ
ncbi:MAG: hypothetical protein WCK53_14360 [Methanomicrobiales archaeon]